jgi:mevalonate kinase
MGLAFVILGESAVSASEFLYGNCKPIKHTEFFQCITVDGQPVYTNEIPDNSVLKKWNKAYIDKQYDKLITKLSMRKFECYLEKRNFIEKIKKCVHNDKKINQLIEQWSNEIVQEKLNFLEQQIKSQIKRICFNEI